jgi:hypothetical protein
MNYFNIQNHCIFAAEYVVFMYVNRPKIYFLNITNRLTFELENLLAVKPRAEFLRITWLNFMLQVENVLQHVSKKISCS